MTKENLKEEHYAAALVRHFFQPTKAIKIQNDTGYVEP